MDTTTILIIVAVVVVVAVVAFFMTRGGGDAEALPPEPRKPEAKPEKRPEPAKPKPAEKQAEPKPAKAEPEKTPEPPKPEPVAEVAKPEVEPEPQPEPETEPASEPEPPAEPEPQRLAPTPSRRANEEDIAALRKGLKSTRGGFISRLAKIFGKKREVDASLLEEVEEVLITADIGVKTADQILDALKEAMEKGELADADRAWAAIKAHAAQILTRHGQGGIVPVQKPTVIVVVGVNGVGKTTTIGKLASRYKEEGKEVLLAAGDTFRAAAVLQLEVWGRRVGCEVVKGKDRADPGSVIFDAVKKGVENGVDVVIADTAGRLHTKTPLMEELKKVGRTAEKALGRPADEILLVLDATTGQNAIQQAELFRDALDVSGLVLTKLDGTAKGGVILGIVDQNGLPVRYVGIGERVEDLREFEAEGFVEALFAKPEEEASNASDVS